MFSLCMPVKEAPDKVPLSSLEMFEEISSGRAENAPITEIL